MSHENLPLRPRKFSKASKCSQHPIYIQNDLTYLIITSYLPKNFPRHSKNTEIRNRVLKIQEIKGEFRRSARRSLKEYRVSSGTQTLRKTRKSFNQRGIGSLSVRWWFHSFNATGSGCRLLANLKITSPCIWILSLCRMTEHAGNFHRKNLNLGTLNWTVFVQ